MLKIYFTAATSGNDQFKPNYNRIINCLKNQAKVISGEQIVNQKLLSADRQMPKKAIFERERLRIDEADLMVAEVTKPSLGVGGEIVYALLKNKPVLALVFTEHEDKISPMIEGNPSDNLFLEHYDFDNLHLILKNFLHHVSQLKNKKGKLIVIDGADGSGKATQAELLVSYLKSKKTPVKYLDFPRYYSSFHGKTVARFLRGEFGDLDQISPYLISLAYALDRVSVKEEMDEFLSNGGIVVANRYASSNMAHQTARLHSASAQQAFLKWVTELEYKIHKIPREDLVLYLYVPWKKSIELTQKKNARDYLKGAKTDIAEKNYPHRMAAEKMYFALSQKHNHWVRINCWEKNRLLSRQQIHLKIIHAARKFFPYL